MLVLFLHTLLPVYLIIFFLHTLAVLPSACPLTACPFSDHIVFAGSFSVLPFALCPSSACSSSACSSSAYPPPAPPPPACFCGVCPPYVCPLLLGLLLLALSLGIVPLLAPSLLPSRCLSFFCLPLRCSHFVHLTFRCTPLFACGPSACSTLRESLCLPPAACFVFSHGIVNLWHAIHAHYDSSKSCFALPKVQFLLLLQIGDVSCVEKDKRKVQSIPFASSHPVLLFALHFLPFMSLSF
jgi:hypothetical protein